MYYNFISVLLLEFWQRFCVSMLPKAETGGREDCNRLFFVLCMFPSDSSPFNVCSKKIIRAGNNMDPLCRGGLRKHFYDTSEPGRE